VATFAAKTSTATMAADPVFIDTNVLVAASVNAHPSHGVASAYLARIEADGAPACISGQVCREFLVVLTRQPVEGRAFTTDEALAALGTWLSACVVFEENEAVLAELLSPVNAAGCSAPRARAPRRPAAAAARP
jgi:predicted nucleic acid-binding protein